MPHPTPHPHPMPHPMPHPGPVHSGNGGIKHPKPGPGSSGTNKPKPGYGGPGGNKPHPGHSGNGGNPPKPSHSGNSGTKPPKPGSGNGGGVAHHHHGPGHKPGGHGRLSKQKEKLILNAIKRLGDKIEDALLLSALHNVGCGQPLSAAQVGCLGDYLNDPGCCLTVSEQGCIQQCLAGYVGGDIGGDDSGTPVPDGDSASQGDEGGVLLRVVQRGGAADLAGLRAGDIVLSFGDVRTHTFEELQEAVGQARGSVKVVYINGESGETEYVMVRPEEGRIGVTCE
jgi:hypothetical protein